MSVAGMAVTVAALVATGLATPASAAPAPSLQTATTLSPGSGLANGSTATLTTDAPFVVAGGTVETITQTFNPATAPVLANQAGLPDITTPEGYAVEYFNDGAWTSTPPTPDIYGRFPNLTKVRAVGSNTVNGWDSATSTQQYARTAASVQAPTKSFSGSGLGDGWDVFFGSGLAAGRIFNVYHHSGGTVGFECHNQRDGSACWTNPNIVFGSGQNGVAADVYSSAHSTGFYSAGSDSIYTFVSFNSAGGHLGMACVTNVSTSTPVPCATPLISLTSATAGYLTAGDAVQIGSKAYARGAASGQNLLCFDLATGAACAGQPFNIGAPSGSGAWEDTRLVALGTNVYFSTGTVLGCFDTVAGALCAGFNGGSNLAAVTQKSLFYTETTSGVPDQVCTYGNMSCWKLDGTAGTWPGGLTRHYSSITDGWGAVHISRTRMFYLNGSTVACYDFLTGAACANFNNASLGNYAYAYATDPANQECVWNNSDQGVITNLDWTTGLPCGQKSTVMFRYTDSVPRLSCADSGRVTSWGALVIHAPRALNIADARISVYTEGGALVPGWANVSVGSTSDTQTGTLDLSSLTVAASGPHPGFYVSFVGVDDVTGVVGDFTYSASAPQVCSVVYNFIPCPSGLGNGSADFPYALPSLTLDSLVEYSGAVNGSQTTSTTATRTSLTATDCLLAPAHGYVLTDITTLPLAGVKVYLYGPDTTTPLGWTLTDQSGYFSFPDLYPNTYQASVSGTGVDAGISGAATALTCLPGGECDNPLGTLLIPYVVHYDGNGNTGGTPPAQEYVSPGQVFTPTPSAGTLVKSHFHFLGWGLHETSTALIDTFTVTGDQTIYAVWELDTHTLTTVVDGGGSTTPAAGDHVYNYGDTITVTTEAAPGWAFTGWSGACAVFRSCDVFIDGDKTVTATFKRLHRLDVTIIGLGSAGPITGDYIEGAVLHFDPIAAAGYRFSGFSGDCTGAVCDVTLDRDHRVIVTFVRVFSLDTKVVGNGTVTAGGSFDRGATTSLVATPATGWRFAGWTGDCSGASNPLSVTVMSDMQCTANFTDQPLLLPVPSGRYAPSAANRSTIVWTAANHATKYRITVNGKVVCTTSALTCTVSMLLGPNSKVYAIALTDALVALPTQLKYRVSKPVRMFVVHFAESRSDLTTADKLRLRAEARKIVALGFTSVTVVGYTDGQGGASGAAPLSKARAAAVAKFLGKFVTVKVPTSGRGNTQFVADNSTETGRAANRRAEGWVK